MISLDCLSTKDITLCRYSPPNFQQHGDQISPNSKPLCLALVMDLLLLGGGCAVSTPPKLCRPLVRGLLELIVQLVGQLVGKLAS